MTYSGISSDYRLLTKSVVQSLEDFHKRFACYPPINDVVVEVAKVLQSHTTMAGVRPLGLKIIVVGEGGMFRIGAGGDILEGTKERQRGAKRRRGSELHRSLRSALVLLSPPLTRSLRSRSLTHFTAKSDYLVIGDTSGGNFSPLNDDSNRPDMREWATQMLSEAMEKRNGIYNDVEITQV